MMHAWSAAVGTLRFHLFSQPRTVPPFFKRMVWLNLGKTSNGTQQFIFRCALSYSCLCIRASLCSPFVHNDFYHWLYIVINSINYGVRTACLVALAWQNSITITKTIIFFHMFFNLETLVNPYGEYFEGKIFTNDNQFVKIFALEKTHYTVSSLNKCRM